MKSTLLAAACVVMIAGCGGGGKTTDSTGTYEAYTTDGRQFPITVNFTALTYSYTALAGTPVVGELAGYGDEFFSFKSPPSSAPQTFTGSFKVGNNVLIGRLSAGAYNLPFIATRTFVTSLADVGSGKFEMASLSTVRSSGLSPLPVTWGTARLSANGKQINYCKGAPTGFAAGAEPLSDPSSCPAGTVLMSDVLSETSAAGVFIQTPAGVTTDDGKFQVRFAKVEDNTYYLASPVLATTADARFSIGVSGARGDPVGQFVNGESSAGTSFSMKFGPAVGAVTFQGGSVAAFGAATATGTVTAVAGSSNAMRLTKTGTSVASGGLLLTPPIAVLANFSATGGDLSLMVK